MRLHPVYAILLGVSVFVFVEFIAWLIPVLIPSPDVPLVSVLISLMGILLLSGPGFLAGILTSHSPVLTGLLVGLACVMADVLLSITLGGLTLAEFIALVELTHVLAQIIMNSLMAVAGFHIRKHLEQ